MFYKALVDFKHLVCPTQEAARLTLTGRRRQRGALALGKVLSLESQSSVKWEGDPCLWGVCRFWGGRLFTAPGSVKWQFHFSSVL